MATRSGSLYPFSMHLADGELRICTIQKSIVKKSIELATTHAKVCENVIRDASSDDECQEEEVKGSQIWYPVKLLLSQTKSRLIYFKSDRERQHGITAILKEQGFSD